MGGPGSQLCFGLPSGGALSIIHRCYINESKAFYNDLSRLILKIDCGGILMLHWLTPCKTHEDTHTKTETQKQTRKHRRRLWGAAQARAPIFEKRSCIH